MHWAVLCNKIAFVKALVKHNAKLDIFDNQVSCLVHVICKSGYNGLGSAALEMWFYTVQLFCPNQKFQFWPKTMSCSPCFMYNV